MSCRCLNLILFSLRAPRIFLEHNFVKIREYHMFLLCHKQWSLHSACKTLGQQTQADVVASINPLFLSFLQVSLLLERVVLGFWLCGDWIVFPNPLELNLNKESVHEGTSIVLQIWVWRPSKVGTLKLVDVLQNEYFLQNVSVGFKNVCRTKDRMDWKSLPVNPIDDFIVWNPKKVCHIDF